MPFRAVASLAAWAASRLLHPGRARRAYRCGRPRIMKVHTAPGGLALDVDARLPPSRGPHANARLRTDARGRDGSIREELAGVVLRSGGRSAFGSKAENVC